MMHGAGRLAALMVILAVCASCDPTKMKAWELAGQPGLLYEVKQYYEHNALEEGGRCARPLLDGVTRSEILEDSAQQMVLDLGYAYRDMQRGPDDDCSESRFLRCTIMAPCRGFAERTFTIARTEDGLDVVGMSGPQRNRRQ
jgi:hypothetical protein